jgi:ELWxxDGT repeat protein
MQRPQSKSQPWRFELMKSTRQYILGIYIFTHIFLCGHIHLFAQTPFLVKDVFQSKVYSSNYNNNAFAETDNYACFFADDGIHGTELWITDGTPYGTRLLKDIFPGQFGSVGFIVHFCRVGNVLYFPISSSGGNKRELWKTDGTVEGTVLVSELPENSLEPEEITAFGNKIIFKVRDGGTINYTLWVSNGTPAGTTALKQFYAPANNNFSFIPYQNGLLFAAGTQNEGIELWKTDGTIDGTVMVKDIYPGFYGSYPDNFAKVKDKVFFKSNHPTYGNQIWMTDGTESGTSLLKELKAGSVSAEPGNLLALNDSLYFIASNQSNQRTLWISDGSSNNIYQVKNSAQGQPPPHIQGLIKCDSFLLISVYKENSWALWRKNGSDGNYFKFKEHTISGTGNFPFFNNWSSSGNISYFNYNTRTDQNQKLWITDGTEDGTHFLKSIDGIDVFSTGISGFSIFANDLYFSIVSLNYSSPIWKSNGTPEGTSVFKEVRDVNYGNFLGSIAHSIEDTLFFMGYKEVIPRNELWRTEGAQKNTRIAMEIEGEFTLLKSFGGFLYLSITNELNEIELWKYNTTGSIKTKLVGGLRGIWDNFFECKGKLYFTANSLAYGEEAWVTDGTAGGTKMLIDNNPGPGYSTILSFFESDTHLYFLTNKGGSNNVDLWAIDLITNIPVFIKDLPYGNHSHLATALGVKGGELYFTQNRFSYPLSTELWKTNGTSIGTTMVGNLPILIETINSGSILYKDHFYFSGENEIHGKELWRTDGTIGGTVLVKDINTNPGGNTYISDLQQLDSIFLFYAYNPETGIEPWRSNGTATGTFIIKDINGENNNYHYGFSSGFYNFKGKAYFGGADSLNNQNLWVTDGTPEGTFPVSNLEEKSGYLIPHNFFSTSSTLFTYADSYFNQKGYGSELWGLALCSDSIKLLPSASNISFNHQPINDSVSCRCNILGELMEKVISNGTKPVTGAIQSKIWIQENAPTGYVNKVFEIFPGNKDSLATGLVTLYYSQEDFDAFNQTNEKKLPSNPTDSIGINNLHVELRKGESINGSGLPVSFKKQIETIQPETGKIKWDSAKNRWEIEVVVTSGFGGFFVKADSCLLSESFTWRGSNSDDWENENNWLEKTKPSIGANIIIPSNRRYYPLISTNISVRKLQLEKGATLKINPGVMIEINDKICR